MDTDQRLTLLEKKIDLIIKAQEKFYPTYLKKFDDIIKAFNKLNESTNGMSNMFGVGMSLIEDNKDVLGNLFSNLTVKESKEQPKKQEKLVEV